MPKSQWVLAIDTMPTKGAVIELNTNNTFASGGAGGSYFLMSAWVKTDSPNIDQFRVTMASLQTSTDQTNVLNIVTRQSFDPRKKNGFGIDVLLKQPLAHGQVVSLAVAQTGASDYWDPELLQD